MARFLRPLTSTYHERQSPERTSRLMRSLDAWDPETAPHGACANCRHARVMGSPDWPEAYCSRIASKVIPLVGLIQRRPTSLKPWVRVVERWIDESGKEQRRQIRDEWGRPVARRKCSHFLSMSD